MHQLYLRPQALQQEIIKTVGDGVNWQDPLPLYPTAAFSVGRYLQWVREVYNEFFISSFRACSTGVLNFVICCGILHLFLHVLRNSRKPEEILNRQLP